MPKVHTASKTESQDLNSQQSDTTAAVSFPKIVSGEVELNHLKSSKSIVVGT